MTDKEFNAMTDSCAVKTAHWLVKAKHEEDTHPKYSHAIRVFRKVHGDKATIDLWGWITWAIVHDITPHRILGAIMHDLSGANDRFMLPRTDGYAVNIWGDDYEQFNINE